MATARTFPSAAGRHHPPPMPAPWYKDGLAFTCTMCGNCCTGAPGYIWVSEVEIDALADRLGMGRAAFRGKYTRTVKGRGVTLIEKANNDCAFFERGRGCTVYEDRPKQCRTWPFWRPLLADRAAWNESAKGCPGMNRGARHDAATIAATAADDGLPR
jgi:Fe-S-cluster containining protein